MVKVEQRHTASLDRVVTVPEIGQDEASLQARTANPGCQGRGAEGAPAVAAIVHDGKEGEARFVLAARPCPAEVVEEREQGIGGLATPTAVQVGPHHGRGPVGGVVAKPPEEGKQNEVGVLAAAAPKYHGHDSRCRASPIHIAEEEGGDGVEVPRLGIGKMPKQRNLDVEAGLVIVAREEEQGQDGDKRVVASLA